MNTGGYKGANQMPTLKASGVTRTRQSGVERLKGARRSDLAESYFAEIVKVYPERYTCDIKSLRSGQVVRDVPVTTTAGVIDGEIYGTFEMPAEGDRVMVGFIENRESLPIILDTVIPFLTSEFGEDSQTPVNSSNKAYGLKLLEAGKENAYRRIFKSGTTIEVDDDGTVTLETPSGTYVLLDETNDKIVVEDQHGNTITLDTNGVIVEDGLGTPNKITFSSSGVVIDDTNGNNVTMATGKVTVNGNLEVLQ